MLMRLEAVVWTHVKEYAYYRRHCDLHSIDVSYTDSTGTATFRHQDDSLSHLFNTGRGIALIGQMSKRGHYAEKKFSLVIDRSCDRYCTAQVLQYCSLSSRGRRKVD